MTVGWAARTRVPSVSTFSGNWTPPADIEVKLASRRKGFRRVGFPGGNNGPSIVIVPEGGGRIDLQATWRQPPPEHLPYVADAGITRGHGLSRARCTTSGWN